MRVKIVFGLLLGLLVAFGAMVATRDRTPHEAPAPPATASASASASGAPIASGSVSASASADASAPPPDAGPGKLFDRQLRVIALGWEVATPGVLANGGLDPGASSEFTGAGLDVRIATADGMPTVESALARGGADKDGADVAVIPFPHFVASYERLRALAPEAFFVVGWSRGREALVASRDALPGPGDKPDAKGGGVSMIGAAGEPATFLGLFALDTNGVPPASVKLVAPGSGDAPLAAVDRDGPADPARRNILLTTADASRLVPFVAIAQHGLVDKNGPALAAWARAWLLGVKKLEGDPPAGARTIATAPNAPEPAALLRRLGEVAPASLDDNARLFGLSGRGALTLDALFQRTWQIWRSVGTLATPAPEAAPVTPAITASLARSFPSLMTPRAPSKAGAPKGAADAKALLTYRQPEGKLDEAALLAQVGLLADVFERSALRVAVIRGGVDAAASKKLADEAEQRFDVAPGRVSVAKKAPPRAAGSIEVLAAP